MGKALTPDIYLPIIEERGFALLGDWTGTQAPVAMRHNACGREVKPSYNSLLQGHGCNACGIDKRAADKRARTEVAAMELCSVVGFVPSVPFPGPGVPWAGPCAEVGHEITPIYGNMRERQTNNCKPCAVEASRGPILDEALVVEVMERGGVRPIEPFRGALSTLLSECLTCGEHVRPTYANVAYRGQGGCVYCAATGIDYAAPGIVYLLVEPAFGAVKVGITTTATTADRIEAHVAEGWQLVEAWNVPTGADAHDIEQTELAYWRDVLDADRKGWMLAADMPRGGHTETASTALVDVEAARSRIEALVA